MRNKYVLALVVAAGVAMSAQTPPADAYRSVAEQYVKLVLALGQHDADYVDAYYGPPEWRKEAEKAKPALAQIDADAATLERSLASGAPATDADEIVRLRHTYLVKQVSALR